MKNTKIIAVSSLLTAIFVMFAMPTVNAEPDTTPPLVLKQPTENISKTIDSATYTYQLQKSAFLAIDDSGTTPTITCSIEGQSQLAPSYRNYWQWTLSPGMYDVYCEIEDNSGNLVNTVWTVEVIRDVLAPQWVKRIAGFYSSQNLIDQDLYLKVIKYFHTAGVIEFDITADNPNDNPRVPSSFKSNTQKWVNNQIPNSQYKLILERMADDGVFLRINV